MSDDLPVIDASKTILGRTTQSTGEVVQHQVVIGTVTDHTIVGDPEGDHDAELTIKLDTPAHMEKLPIDGRVLLVLDGSTL